MATNTPSLFNLIAQIAGYNKVQGGPELVTDAQGNTIVVPKAYESKKGFFAPWGTGEATARDYNQRLMTPVLQEQARGSQQRNLAREKALQDYVSKYGVIPSEEMIQDYASQIGPTELQTAKERAEEAQLAQRDIPEMRTRRQGRMATNLGPLYEALAKMGIGKSVSAGQAMPTIDPRDILNPEARGVSIFGVPSRTTEEVIKEGIPMEIDGQTIMAGRETRPVTTADTPYFQRATDPALMRRVEQGAGGQGQTAAPATGASQDISDFLRGGGNIPLGGGGGSLFGAAGGNIPAVTAPQVTTPQANKPPFLSRSGLIPKIGRFVKSGEDLPYGFGGAMPSGTEKADFQPVLDWLYNFFIGQPQTNQQ